MEHGLAGTVLRLVRAEQRRHRLHQGKKENPGLRKAGLDSPSLLGGWLACLPVCPTICCLLSAKVSGRAVYGHHHGHQPTNQLSYQWRAEIGTTTTMVAELSWRPKRPLLFFYGISPQEVVTIMQSITSNFRSCGCLTTPQTYVAVVSHIYTSSKIVLMRYRNKITTEKKLTKEQDDPCLSVYRLWVCLCMSCYTFTLHSSPHGSHTFCQTDLFWLQCYLEANSLSFLHINVTIATKPW